MISVESVEPISYQQCDDYRTAVDIRLIMEPLLLEAKNLIDICSANAIEQLSIQKELKTQFSLLFESHEKLKKDYAKKEASEMGNVLRARAADKEASEFKQKLLAL